MRALCARLLALALAAPVALALAAPAGAADKITIGFISTLTGPGGLTGLKTREGMRLGIEVLGGKIGGLPVDFLSEDDQQKPEIGRQIAEKYLLQDHADVVVAGGFSNVFLAIEGVVARAQVPVISVNAGPSALAGKDCSPYFFSTSWQGDNYAEAMGTALAKRGVKNPYLMAPNYVAGRDVLTGFKRTFTGPLAGEAYTPLSQLDFSAELASLRAANPGAVFAFYPGGLGLQFLKQWAQSGLGEKIPLYTAYTLDVTSMAAVGEAALGTELTSFWSADLDNPANRKFVAAYRKMYDGPPMEYAAQAYDAIMLLDAAVRAINGRIEDKPAFLAAIRHAKFDSVRGNFHFANDGFPTQDFYLEKIERGADGKPTMKLEGKVLSDYSNAYTKECPLK